MTQRKYLITAATGKTGVHTINQLLKDGHAVRALVHSQDERSESLRKAGAEVVVGDLLDHSAVQRAVDGVSAAYLCYPVRPGFIQATAYFADAAKRAGLDVVVSMSQISARDDSDSHAARDHWIAERVLDWSGVPSVHLRPTLFSEWLTFPWVRNRLVEEGKITLPFGEGRHAPIGAEDQARVITTILTNPGGHIGKIYPLYGPVEFSQKELAAELTRLLGREIVYSPSTLEEYEAYLNTFDLPEFIIQHFIAIAVDYQNGIFSGVDGVISEMTGQAPQTVEQFVKTNFEAFKR